ncbi:MAG: phosphoribosyl-ATP diphosphatase [Pseudomonadota bacterium]
MTDTRNSNSLGNPSSFIEAVSKLSETIDSRADADPSSSYTASLLAKGQKKVAQKISEEGSELAIAIVSEGEHEVASEAADLIYHLLVGLRARGVTLEDVATILKARESQSGLAEKASREKN